MHKSPDDPDELVGGLAAGLPDEEPVALPREHDELDGLQPGDVLDNAVMQHVLVGVDDEHWGKAPPSLPPRRSNGTASDANGLAKGWSMVAPGGSARRHIWWNSALPRGSPGGHAASDGAGSSPLELRKDLFTPPLPPILSIQIQQQIKGTIDNVHFHPSKL